MPASAWPLTAAAARGSAAIEHNTAVLGAAGILAAAGEVLSPETLAAFGGIAPVTIAGDRPACKLAGMEAFLAGTLMPLITAASRVPAAGTGCREATPCEGP